jgi:amino acid transporter
MLHGKSSRLICPGPKHNSGHIFDRRPIGHYSVRLDLCFSRISWYSGKLSRDMCCIPNSRGVYSWSAMLSTQQYAPLVSWVTEWFTLVGNWTITLSINFSGSQLILSAITLWDDSFVANQWQTILTFWAITVVTFAVNAFGAKYLDLINKVCIYWTSASVIIIIITVLVMSDDRRNAEFIFAHFDSSASG